ncbi:HTH 38 domain containing protein, partial [Asbolus verrucosus]
MFIMPRARRQANFHQLNEFDRGRIVGLREAGLSFRNIATRMNRSLSTVLGSKKPEHAEPKAQNLTPEREDHRLRLMTLRDRFTSTRAIADQWFTEHGRTIEMDTVYRHIRSFGLVLYRRHFVLLLTPKYRLAWCRERRYWNREWNMVFFSDEFRFCFGMHDRRAMVRRRRGERRDPQFSVERHVQRTVGVMM